MPEGSSDPSPWPSQFHRNTPLRFTKHRSPHDREDAQNSEMSSKSILIDRSYSKSLYCAHNGITKQASIRSQIFFMYMYMCLLVPLKRSVRLLPLSVSLDSFSVTSPCGAQKPEKACDVPLGRFCMIIGTDLYK